MTAARLESKLTRIESDVLFDKFLADQQWRTEKIALEKEIGAAKKQAKLEQAAASNGNKEKGAVDDDINNEAERIAAEILAETNDDDDLAGLFASLPKNEVDPSTNKMQTVVTSKEGVRIVIRDFGKWTGINPRRVLEEACRSR